MGSIPIFFFAIFLFTSCAKEPISWQTDYDTAITLAQNENKNIFLIFTGLEWDTISKTLKTDILGTSEFMQNVGKHYILLHIDIPQIYETTTQQNDIENYELAQDMGILSFPTAVLLTQTEQLFAFLPMTTEIKLPIDLVALVDAEKVAAKKITSAYEKLENAEGLDRVKAIDDYVNSLPEQFAPPELYAEVVKLDPENTSGLLGKYKTLLAHVVAAHAYSVGDAETAVNSFLVLIDEPQLLSPLETQNAYYGIVYYGIQSGLIPEEEGITYLQQAYNAAPDSEDAQIYLAIIKEFEVSNASQ